MHLMSDERVRDETDENKDREHHDLEKDAELAQVNAESAEPEVSEDKHGEEDRGQEEREQAFEGPVLEKMTALEEQMSELKQLFETKISKDEDKGELIRKLYGEVARYRDDFVFKHIKKGIYMDLIGLFDRVSGLVSFLEAAPNVDKDILDNILSFQKEILHILKRQGVFLIDREATKFDEQFQEAIDLKPMSRPEDDQTVIEVVRRGFTYHGTILRPEEVVVGKYKEKKEED